MRIGEKGVTDNRSQNGEKGGAESILCANFGLLHRLIAVQDNQRHPLKTLDLLDHLRECVARKGDDEGPPKLFIKPKYSHYFNFRRPIPLLHSFSFRHVVILFSLYRCESDRCGFPKYSTLDVAFNINSR